VVSFECFTGACVHRLEATVCFRKPHLVHSPHTSTSAGLPVPLLTTGLWGPLLVANPNIVDGGEPRVGNFNRCRGGLGGRR
jgi:hypothetical protein